MYTIWLSYKMIQQKNYWKILQRVIRKDCKKN